MSFLKGDSMGTILLIGVCIFVLWIVAYTTGYMFEMIFHPEDISREYWNEYWGRDDTDGENKTTRQEV